MAPLMLEIFVQQIADEPQEKETEKTEDVEKQACEIKEGEMARMKVCAMCRVFVSALHKRRQMTTFPIVANFVCHVNLSAAARIA